MAGLSEYWQGAAYDTYRSALRNATAQREAARQQTEPGCGAETAYTPGLMGGGTQCGGGAYPSWKRLQPESGRILLQKAAAEQAEVVAPRHPRAEKRRRQTRQDIQPGGPAPRRAAGYPAR